MKMKREIKYIVIHTTATHQTATVENIQRYWKESLLITVLRNKKPQSLIASVRLSGTLAEGLLFKATEILKALKKIVHASTHWKNMPGYEICRNSSFRDNFR